MTAATPSPTVSLPRHSASDVQRGSHSIIAAAAPKIAAATSLLARPGHATGQPAPSMLTFNSVPTLPGVSDLPWSSVAGRRFYGFGESVGPGSITVFALRMRDHMQLTASFDESSAAPEAVRAALDAISRGEALRGALTQAIPSPDAA